MVKMNIDKPEDLKSALLTSGISSVVAERIVAHYTRDFESF